MAQIYYCLHLDDYAKPGFFSASKTYYGTMNHIEKFMNALMSNKRKESMKAITDAFKEYCEGNTSVTHNVAYNENILMEPVKLVKEEVFEIDNPEWEHINIWGFSYMMKASKATVTQILLKKGKKYIRCIKPVFTDLYYTGHPECEYLKLTDNFWGFPEVIEMKNEVYNSRLYQVEKIYEKKTEAMKDMGDISKLNYAEFCNDIFGDG